MKFCKDCRYYQPPQFQSSEAWKYARCLSHPERERNLITGEWSDTPRFCDSTRLIGDHCGPDAKWFEAAP